MIKSANHQQVLIGVIFHISNYVSLFTHQRKLKLKTASNIISFHS